MEQMSLDQRFNILQLVATFESRVCRVTLQEPYFDELHDFYELEIDGFAGQNIDRIDHAVVLKSLTSALLRAKYRPADAPLFFSRLGERTLELLRPHRQTLMKSSKARLDNLRSLDQLLSCMTHFGILERDAQTLNAISSSSSSSFSRQYF